MSHSKIAKLTHQLKKKHAHTQKKNVFASFSQVIDQHCIFQDFDDLVSVLFWKLLFIFALVNFTFSWSFPTNFFTTFPRLLKLVCKSWRSPLFRHILCTHRNNSLKWFSVLLFSFPLFFWILILVYFLNLTIACQFPCLWLFLFADFQYMTIYAFILDFEIQFALASLLCH